MNGSEIIISTGNDVTKWDFPAIKAELERRLADYADLVYTDESIGAAKDDRATLRKVKRISTMQGKHTKRSVWSHMKQWNLS